MRILPGVFALLCACAVRAAESPREDAHFPFRTDFANEHLPWYQLKPGEFPPHHSEHRIGGELVEADFINRSGQFKMNGTGELVNFTLPPFGSVMYLNTEADLRDVPLGTQFLFFLYQDESGAFTRAASMQDDYTLLAGNGSTYRLDELKLGDGKLVVTKQKPGTEKPEESRSELRVYGKTRVWKGDKQITLNDLAAGDLLLVNFNGNTPDKPRRCTDIWVGPDTHKRATEQQRKKHSAFLKTRGIPGWIDKVEGKNVTVTLFSGNRACLQALFKDEDIAPAQWATEHRFVSAVVADEHLRTYNPPVDNQRSIIVERQKAPDDCYGCSGERWVIKPELLLEGFRKGHILRLFVHPAWPIKDMAYGEGVYTEVSASETRDPELPQYPFRTDFGHAQLPWYRLKSSGAGAEFPPFLSEHRVAGELVKVEAVHRSGQFRMDYSGEIISFTLPPFGYVMYLNAEADPEDIPLGMRYLFYLYQDDKGAFTKAAVIMDEYTYLASNKVSYRLETANLDEGKLLVARQIPPVRNDKDEMEKPPDLGRRELQVDNATRVWKGDKQAKASDLAVGDELLINITGRTKTDRGRCTDIWIGTDTQKTVTDQQRKKHNALVKKRGMQGWIESVEGKKITVSFFAGNRADFSGMLNSEPQAKNVKVTLINEELQPSDPAGITMAFRGQLPEGSTFGTYGCSGVRWILEAEALPEKLHVGQLVHIAREENIDSAKPKP